jgi:hypothetical protein
VWRSAVVQPLDLAPHLVELVVGALELALPLAVRRRRPAFSSAIAAKSERSSTKRRSLSSKASTRVGSSR